MKTINLREYYPYYTTDVFVEVPDEVAELLRQYKLKEAADFLRTYRHRAFYSLDYHDGVEYSALELLYQPSSYEILERQRITELLYQGLAALPEKQRNRIWAHYYLGMSKAAIAKAEGCHANSVKESIQRGLRQLKKFLEKNL